MQSFKFFLNEQETKLATVADLDKDFMRSAMKSTSFNLKAKDFESLKYKKEIQFLIQNHMFPAFKMINTVNAISPSKLKGAINALRQSDSNNNFDNLYKYNLKGVGPGEVMLYFLCNNAHLGGGSSAGLDLVDASGNYEIKSVSYSKQGYVSNFKVGGTFNLSPIIQGIAKLKEEAGLGKGSEINAGELAKIKIKFPKELKKFYADFAKLTYDNYFKNHDIIFMANLKGGGYQIGDLIDVKRVQKKDIVLERITSGTIKPRILMK